MIIQKNEQGDVVGQYKTSREAAAAMGCGKTSINRAIAERTKFGGFTWNRTDVFTIQQPVDKIVLERGNDVSVIRIPAKGELGWEQWVLLMSDEHYDSKHCNRELLKKHHELAKSRNAIILKFGDIFDVMGGKYDPRSSKSSLRPEYHVDDYFDEIVRDAVRFYEPYKNNIQYISYGNHEISVRKRQEVDILKNLSLQLGDVQLGKYGGFIRLLFEFADTKESKILYYNHGSGGNSPVTRGVIKTNRRQSYIQSDYLISGHTHNEWCLSLPMVRVNDDNEIEKGEQVHISLGTYKDDSFSGGWADHNEFPPPNMGGAWIRFYWDNGIQSDIIRANK